MFGPMSKAGTLVGMPEAVESALKVIHFQRPDNRGRNPVTLSDREYNSLVLLALVGLDVIAEIAGPEYFDERLKAIGMGSAEEVIKQMMSEGEVN